MKFKSVILRGKKTATGIEVPSTVVEQLAAGKKPAVVVSVNDYVYRTTIGSMGGRYMLPLSADHRAQSGLKAGEDVDVNIEVDTEPRSVTVPETLKLALEKDSSALGAFEALSYSRQRWFVLNVESAKTEATREKRVNAALAELSGRTERAR